MHWGSARVPRLAREAARLRRMAAAQTAQVKRSSSLPPSDRIPARSHHHPCIMFDSATQIACCNSAVRVEGLHVPEDILPCILPMWTCCGASADESACIPNESRRCAWRRRI